MRNIFLFMILVVVTGCAHIEMSAPMEDGTVAKASYTRWFNQSIDGFFLESPEGWKVGFESQKSDIEIAFELGALSVKTSNGEKK